MPPKRTRKGTSKKGSHERDVVLNGKDQRYAWCDFSDDQVLRVIDKIFPDEYRNAKRHIEPKGMKKQTEDDSKYSSAKCMTLFSLLPTPFHYYMPIRYLGSGSFGVVIACVELADSNRIRTPPTYDEARDILNREGIAGRAQVALKLINDHEEDGGEMNDARFVREMNVFQAFVDAGLAPTMQGYGKFDNGEMMSLLSETKTEEKKGKGKGKKREKPGIYFTAMHKIDGVLRDWLIQEKRSDEELHFLAVLLTMLVGEMEKHGLTHGDLRYVNIGYTMSMKPVKTKKSSKKGRGKSKDDAPVVLQEHRLVIDRLYIIDFSWSTTDKAHPLIDLSQLIKETHCEFWFMDSGLDPDRKMEDIAHHNFKRLGKILKRFFIHKYGKLPAMKKYARELDETSTYGVIYDDLFLPYAKKYFGASLKKRGRPSSKNC